MTTRCVLAISMSVLALLPATVMAAPSESEPFKSTIPGGAGLKCSATAGYEGEVRFCEGNGKSERVPSWDGVPLDVDVTLPPASDGSGPYPGIPGAAACLRPLARPSAALRIVRAARNHLK